MVEVEISDITQIAKSVREERKAQHVTQAQLAQLANVGLRFVRDLEAGKESVHADKLFQVLSTLGIAVKLSLPSGK